MAKQTPTRIGRARDAVRVLTPLALSAKAWWDGLSEKEKAQYREQVGRALRQAHQVGKSGLDAARARTGATKKRKR